MALTPPPRRPAPPWLQRLATRYDTSEAPPRAASIGKPPAARKAVTTPRTLRGGR
jgi:hypothetical protein